MKKKIVLIIAGVIFIMALYFLLRYCFSYHESIDYTKVSSIQCTSNFGYVSCETEKDIKNMTRKIRMINFYPSQNKQLHDSPKTFVKIRYKDGAETNINIDCFNAFISYQSDKENINSRLTKFYYVNPLAIYLLFY